MTIYLRRRDHMYVNFIELPEDDQVWHMDNPQAKAHQREWNTPSSKQCNADLVMQKQVMPRTCAVCGLGPCQRYPMRPDESKPRPLRTLVLSPFAGDYERNKVYAQDCMIDSLRRGEAPFLSHLLYPQVLIDGIEAEREMGLRCEHSWLEVAEQCIAYTDLGWSAGMHKAADAWQKLSMHHAIQLDVRQLGGPWSRS